MVARLMSVGSRLRQIGPNRLRAIGGVSTTWNPLTADVFVDSVNGSDSNAGTYNAPKQTLAGAAAVLSGTKSMALFRGSTWREAFTVPYTGFRLGVVGAGNPPVIDGANVISGGWTNVGGATPNVWSQTLVSANPAGVAVAYASVFENDALLPFRVNVAAVEAAAAPGWYTTARTSNTFTAYIYSTTDPNSNGKVYEYTHRYIGILGHSQVVGDRPAYIYGPIKLRRHRDPYGNIGGGLGTQSRLHLELGSLHHGVTEAAEWTDVLMTGFDVSLLQSPQAVYRNIGAGYSHVSRRVHVVGDGTDQQAGLFSHGGASVWDNCTADQCVVSGVSDAFAWGSTLTNTVTNCAAINCLNGVDTVSGAVAVVRRHQHKCRAGGGGTGVLAGGVDPALRNVLVEDSVFYFPSGAASGVNLAAGSITLRRCVIYSLSDNFNGIYTPSGSATITLENCIVILLGSGGRQGTGSGTGTTFFGSNNLYVGNEFWQFSGGAYNGFTNGLAAWQTLTGQDAGSVYSASVSGLFSGTVANGDFRLASTGLGATARAMGCGPATYWDHNTRAIASGPPIVWPDPPANATEWAAWLADPTTFDWYS